MKITLKGGDHAICTDKLSQGKVTFSIIFRQISVKLCGCSLFIIPLIFMTHCVLEKIIKLYNFSTDVFNQ